MLLNTPQHAEQTPTKKNHAAQNVNSAEVKKFCSESRLNGLSLQPAEMESGEHA